MIENHEYHQQALTRLSNYFSDIVYRGDLNRSLVSEYDLVITVGGDGTVLDVSHYIFDSTPVFGVNSTKGAKLSSEGFFCCATIHDLEEKLDQLHSGKLNRTALNRLELRLDGQMTDELALNDILVCHSNPASMSWYRLICGNKEEHQRSSGVWVCTAAGSTAASLSAGGSVMEIGSASLQYVVREPAISPSRNFSLLKGLSGSLEFIAEMRSGCIYVDGSHIRYDFPYGSRLSISISSNPLVLLGFDHKKRQHYLSQS
jgi:NAD+ kinase